jgi:hypothetical protein
VEDREDGWVVKADRGGRIAERRFDNGRLAHKVVAYGTRGREELEEGEGGTVLVDLKP